MQILSRIAGLCSPDLSSATAPPSAPAWARRTNTRSDLPAGWTAHIDARNGRTFFLDHALATSTWTPPAGAIYTPGVPRPWERAVDPRAGRYYYINREEKRTQWRAPEGVAADAPEYAGEEELKSMEEVKGEELPAYEKGDFELPVEKEKP